MLAALLRRYRLVFHATCTALLVLTALVAPGVAAQTSPSDGDEAVTSIAITLTLDQTIDEGTAWIGQSGLHVRNLMTSHSVAGDLTGNATLDTDVDWAGPCDAVATNCEGARESFADIEITSDTGTWRGSLALEQFPDTRTLARGILIGRHGASDRVLVLDDVEEATPTTLSLTGRMVTLDGPIGGVQMSHSACITGETTADGGFLGSRGLIEDNGPARIIRREIGSDSPSGVYGNVTDIGHKGTLRGIFIARHNNQHAYGSFVIMGESGPYSGLIGYGRAMMSVNEEPRCQSGMQVTSTWTGQARYLTDPATFLAPRVYFASPADRARTPTPVVLELVAEHVDIEPAGSVRDGAGYLVVIVDAPCIGPGEPIPDDEQHFHLIEGETSLELNLFTGLHRLCLQLADGTGIAQPATDVITVEVVSSGGEGL